MSKSGYLYVMHHPSFLHYGPDVYKLGESNNPTERMKGYRTSFVGECKFLHLSNKFHDCCKAEKIMFYILRHERLAKNREFFQTSLDRVKYIINELEAMTPEQLDRFYTAVCWEVVPSVLRTKFAQNKQLAEEELKMWSSNEWTQNLPYDEFLERFRFRPSIPEMYPTYVLPEHIELQKLKAVVDQL